MFVRTLAALDLIYHGSRLIMLEFAAGVIIPGALGLLSLLRGHAAWQKPLGWYLLLVGLNYVPLLIEALRLLAHPEEVHAIREQLDREPDLGMRMTKQSLVLVVPLSIPLLWLRQGWR